MRAAATCSSTSGYQRRRLPLARRGHEGLLRRGAGRQGPEGGQRHQALARPGSGRGGAVRGRRQCSRDRIAGPSRVQCRGCLDFAKLSSRRVALACARVCRRAAQVIEIGPGERARARLPGQPLPGGLPHDGLPGQGRGRARLMAVPADGKIVAWTIRSARPARSRSTSSTTTSAASRGGRSRPQARQAKLAFTRERPQPGCSACSRTSAPPCSSRSTGRSPSEGLPDRADGAELGAGAGAGAGHGTLWRASRLTSACDAPGKQSAQLGLGNQVPYRCLYRTARLTYSATMITTPTPPKQKG